MNFNLFWCVQGNSCENPKLNGWSLIDFMHHNSCAEFAVIRCFFFSEKKV